MGSTERIISKVCLPSLLSERTVKNIYINRRKSSFPTSCCKPIYGRTFLPVVICGSKSFPASSGFVRSLYSMSALSSGMDLERYPPLNMILRSSLFISLSELPIEILSRFPSNELTSDMQKLWTNVGELYSAISASNSFWNPPIFITLSTACISSVSEVPLTALPISPSPYLTSNITVSRAKPVNSPSSALKLTSSVTPFNSSSSSPEKTRSAANR